MSAWNTTTLTLHECAVSAVDIFAYLFANGWSMDRHFLHLPLDAEDEFSWTSARLEPDTFMNIVERQTLALRRSGAYLLNIEQKVHASFAYSPRERALTVDWGADCPTMKGWPRVVDPAWSFDVIRIIVRSLDLPVMRVMHCCKDPH